MSLQNKKKKEKVICMAYVLLIIGFLFLIKGADWLVQGASSIAKRFGVSSLLIGLTIVAVGTSAPEVAVSVTGALKGANGLTVGNVLGSNLFNLAMVAGLLAILKPLAFDRDLVRMGLPFGFGSIALMVILSLDGVFSRLDGCLLLVGLIAYLLCLILPQLKKQGDSDESTEEVSEEVQVLGWGLSILLVIVGLAGVLIGGDWVVEQATVIAKGWGWSDQLIGLTIVAIGTSLPELVTSLMALKKGEVGLALGNVFGSNILNILFVLGLSCAITPISMSSTSLLDLGITFVITSFTVIVGFFNRQLVRWQGLVLVLAYVGYLVYSVLN